MVLWKHVLSAVLVAGALWAAAPGVRADQTDPVLDALFAALTATKNPAEAAEI